MYADVSGVSTVSIAVCTVAFICSIYHICFNATLKITCFSLLLSYHVHFYRSPSSASGRSSPLPRTILPTFSRWPPTLWLCRASRPVSSEILPRPALTRISKPSLVLVKSPFAHPPSTPWPACLLPMPLHSPLLLSPPVPITTTAPNLPSV